MTKRLEPIDTSKYKITETGQVLKMNKDEMKDEMKDRISMTLKDLVLQQGFEIICKNLAELEKENAELKTKKIPQLERKIASIRGCHSVAVKKLNARIEQVERLKKKTQN